MDTHQEAFLEEAHELLSELETSLLELEERPGDMDLVSRVFRSMHTIKGSGAMFGFDDVAKFTHEVETAFDMVRDGRVQVTPNLINATLSARDQIMSMLSEAEGDGNADKERSQEIIACLKELTAGNGEKKEEPHTNNQSIDTDATPHSPEKETTYRIHFVPAPDVFANGTNPLLLLNELRELGECNVVAHPDAIPSLAAYDPESCYTFWDIILTTSHSIDDIKDVFIFVEDDCELDIHAVETVDGLTDVEAESKKLGEILVERGDVTPEDLEKALESQKRIGEVLKETANVPDRAINTALIEQEHVKRIQQKKQQEKQQKITASSIRVDSDKLDSLVDLVGELVTVQARLTQKASLQKDSELLGIAEEIVRLTDALRDNTMSIRMLPIGTTFNKFRRLVRDLSNEQGKDIVLTTEGAETELDKTVIEKLSDPLVHLIRNSIDHGIEIPEKREASGKIREGNIHLSARHSGGNVLIEITDDGAGLNPAILRDKAISKGLIAPDGNPTEQEIFSLLFAPGFSTAETVTDISGRGVGMDVVKRGIEDLRGTIDISSRQGRGTTFTLKLPLTLAIIDGLLVKIGEDYYVMPLASVEECVELCNDEAVQARSRNMMSYRGKAHSYLSLRKRFKVEGDSPATEKVVITEVNGVKVGLAVDQVIGQHQTVIKSLSEVCKDVKGYAGATIMGDGTVALILDVNMLVQSMAQAPLEEQ